MLRPEKTPLDNRGRRTDGDYLRGSKQIVELIEAVFPELLEICA